MQTTHTRRSIFEDSTRSTDKCILFQLVIAAASFAHVWGLDTVTIAVHHVVSLGRWYGRQQLLLLLMLGGLLLSEGLLLDLLVEGFCDFNLATFALCGILILILGLLLVRRDVMSLLGLFDLGCLNWSLHFMWIWIWIVSWSLLVLTKSDRIFGYMNNLLIIWEVKVGLSWFKWDLFLFYLQLESSFTSVLHLALLIWVFLLFHLELQI